MKYLAILPFLLLSACAFTELKVTPGNTPINTGISGGDQREIVVAVPFSDDRQIKNRCGMKKNGYNMDTANALCSQPPADKLAELLADELKKAGFKVSTHGDPQAPTGVKVEGTLLKFFVEPVIGFAMGSLETDIHVRLIASTQSGLRAERSFFVKGTQSAMVGTDSNFQASVDDATAQIVKQMVAAIVSLFNRYPKLGGLPADLLAPTPA